MYKHLTDDGILVSITGVNWTFSENKKANDFREWLQKVNAEIYNIPKGKFKESGTPIETRAIVIKSY